MINNEICHVVKNFFQSGKLFNVVNCTTITLLPKAPNLSSINEYILIAYSAVLYKLIAKVLANRLQK